MQDQSLDLLTSSPVHYHCTMDAPFLSDINIVGKIINPTAAHWVVYLKIEHDQMEKTGKEGKDVNDTLGMHLPFEFRTMVVFGNDRNTETYLEYFISV